MPLRNVQTTMVESIREDEELAIAVFNDAIKELCNGDAETCRLLLRNVVNGTLGFEPLSEVTGIPAKSLHRMLSIDGNPSMSNISSIIQSLREHLNIELNFEAKQTELV